MNIHEIKAQREGNKAYTNALLKNISELKQKAWTELMTEVELLKASFTTAMENLAKEKSVELSQKLSRIKELKGKQGDKGISGKDGRTPTEKELLNLIIPRIPRAIPGEKGKDGEPYILTTRDQKDIAKMVLANIRQPKDGVDGRSADTITPEQIIEKINSAALSFQIDWSRIKNAPRMKKSGKYMHGGGISSLAAGSGITLIADGNGGYTISSTASGGGFNLETPSPLPDSSTLSFTVMHIPIAVLLRNMMYLEGEGYTFDAGTMTITIGADLTPQTGDSFKSIHS